MKGKSITAGILLSAATIIGSPSFGQNTQKIIKQTNIELMETLPEDISDYRIEWVLKHFGPKKTIEVINAELLKQINEIRKANGVDSLTINPLLTKTAQKYAEEIDKDNNKSHVGRNGSNVMTRAKKNGFKATHISENIGCDYTSINDAINHRSDKIKHPGHFKNMIDPNVIYLGVGYCNGYRVNIFSGEDQK